MKKSLFYFVSVVGAVIICIALGVSNKTVQKTFPKITASAADFMQVASLIVTESCTVPDAVQQEEAVTLKQALSLMGSRGTFYLSPTIATYGVEGQTNRSLSTTGSATAWSVVVTTNAVAGSYLCNFIASTPDMISAVSQGKQTTRLRMTRNVGGHLTAKVEGYIFNTNTLAKTEYAETGEAVTIGATATPLDFLAAIPYSTNSAPNEVYMISIKAVTASGISSITVSGGSNALSYVELPTPSPIDLGVRGATSIKTVSGAATGTYSATTRVLTLPATLEASSFLFTNAVSMKSGVLNGTNGVYWSVGTNNYWLLFQ